MNKLRNNAALLLIFRCQFVLLFLVAILGISSIIMFNIHLIGGNRHFNNDHHNEDIRSKQIWENNDNGNNKSKEQQLSSLGKLLYTPKVSVHPKKNWRKIVQNPRKREKINFFLNPKISRNLKISETFHENLKFSPSWSTPRLTIDNLHTYTHSLVACAIYFLFVTYIKLKKPIKKTKIKIGIHILLCT